MRAGTIAIPFVSLFTLFPSVASAQAVSGSIAGVVRDATAAVLPGVTVEATSPALIEKIRTVITDDQGQYKILDLRPGTYTVTFSLTGFAPVKREGLQLVTGFTATANAELRVGSLEETVTVSGASPMVDVQNVRTQKVLSQEELDTLPTGKTVQAWAALTLGAVTIGGGQDVGGNKGETAGSMAIHGGRGLDQQMFMDGMTYNIGAGQGGGWNIILKNNELATQELTLETSGMSAESEAAGVQINIVPKEGGNVFRGSAVGAYTNRDLQSNNLTETLQGRGLRSTSEVKHIYDGGASFGGPFARNKLWFFTAHRWWGAYEYVPGNYFNATPGTMFYTPDFNRPAYIGQDQRDNTFRVTWQANAKQKFTFLQVLQHDCQCYSSVAQNVSPEASSTSDQEPLSLTQVAWTYPKTNRLLLQAGLTHMPNGQKIIRTAGVTSADIPITELSTGYRYGASTFYDDPNGPTGQQRYDQTNGRFVLSYITGSHAFRAGFNFFVGSQRGDGATQDHATSYEMRKPTPDALPNPVSVTYYAYPRWTESRGRKFALYAQDQWTLRYLTLNAGVRLDTLHAWNPAQTKPAGVWTRELDFEKVDDVPNWKDVSPRLGAAYDLFGNGKTAVKVSVGRYVQAEFTTIASATNPQNAIVGSAFRTWDDADHDYVPQESELGALSNNLFGTVLINTRYADDVLKGWGVRPYNWTATASLQHELRPDVGITFHYYRRWYGNFRVTDNLRVSPEDYDPYCVTAPVDQRLPNGGGYDACGLYDIKPTAFGTASFLVTRDSHYGKRTEVYNGFELAINTRLKNGGLLSGGMSTGQTVTDSCFVVDSPQEARPGFCHVANPFWAQTQFKLSAVYPLPWDMQASAVFQNLGGIPISGVVPLTSQGQLYGDPIVGASYVASNSEIAPSLGRDLGACANRVPCTATATVNLQPPYDEFEDRLTQVDVRLAKSMLVRRVRIQGMFDIYNAFNASTVLGMITRVGPSYLQPTQILAGRLFKFSAQITF